VLDVGASSDLIFRYIGKTGVGLNISDRAVDYMEGKGIEAVVGDAEHLAYEDNSVDYVLCYQTLEHLENTMAALRELGRVAREKVFISIPHVRQTRVCPFEPTDRGRHRWHCVEFSPEDFERVMIRTGLTIERRVDVVPYSRPRSLKQKLFLRHWKNHPWFMGFVMYQAKSVVRSAE